MTQKDLFRTDAYDYHLPGELIAQHPKDKRDESRLLIVDRSSGSISEGTFRDITTLLNPGDSLVLNNTRVIPARLFGKKDTGGAVEVLLSRPRGDFTWEVLARPGRKLKTGSTISFSSDLSARVLETLPEGEKILKFDFQGDFDEILNRVGHMPLPHYIERTDTSFDQERYQTVFAKEKGAIAAPTAGLHFTQEILNTLSAKGVEQSEITLHVGVGTFKPVSANDIRDHRMHQEWFQISPEVADKLNQRTNKQRQICVGTTSCRALESAATEEGVILPGQYETDIFIYPGYRFKYVNALLTNFHLPRSTLLMLVSSFAGYELMREAYSFAVEKQFRFFSYGDAMLIL